MAVNFKNVLNTLNALISSTESNSGNTPISRGTGSPSFAADYGAFTTKQLFPTGTTALQIPNSVAGVAALSQFYFKNLDKTGNIQLTGVIAGVTGIQTLAVLGPGDQFIFWTDSDGTASPYTAINVVVAANAGCSAEYFLGGVIIS